jgi:hypothetical protein
MFQTLSNDTLGPNLDMFITFTFAPKIQKNNDIIIPKMLMTLSSLSYLPCNLTHTLTHLWSVLQFGDVSKSLAFNLIIVRVKAFNFHAALFLVINYLFYLFNS